MTKEKKFKTYKISSGGFTLIEGAIAVAIASVLLAVAIDLIKTSMDKDAIAQNAQRLATIQQAILTFEANNNRLPCPASYTAQPTAAPATPYFGRELNYTSGTPSSGCATYPPTAPNAYLATGRTTGSTSPYPGGAAPTGQILFGAVPVRDLGLPDSYIADTYGYLFTYAVTQSATASPINPFGGVIDVINPVTGTTLLATAGTATYALVDHGKDGKGAFSYGITGTPVRTCTSAAGYDKVNCSFETGAATPFAFNNAAFNASVGLSHFDDMVVNNATNTPTSSNTCTAVRNAPITAAYAGTSAGTYMTGLDVGAGLDVGDTVIYLGAFTDKVFFSDFYFSGSNSTSPIVVASCAAGSHVVSGGCTETLGMPTPLTGNFLTNIYTADLITTTGAAPSPCGNNTTSSQAPCDTGLTRQLVTPPMSHPVYAICCTGSN